MNITIYVDGKKLRFIGNFGWYKGIEFSLLRVNMLNILEGYNAVYLLEFQIAKFSTLIGFDWEA